MSSVILEPLFPSPSRLGCEPRGCPLGLWGAQLVCWGADSCDRVANGESAVCFPIARCVHCLPGLGVLRTALGRGEAEHVLIRQLGNEARGEAAGQPMSGGTCQPTR